DGEQAEGILLPEIRLPGEGQPVQILHPADLLRSDPRLFKSSAIKGHPVVNLLHPFPKPSRLEFAKLLPIHRFPFRLKHRPSPFSAPPTPVAFCRGLYGLHPLKGLATPPAIKDRTTGRGAEEVVNLSPFGTAVGARRNDIQGMIPRVPGGSDPEGSQLLSPLLRDPLGRPGRMIYKLHRDIGHAIHSEQALPHIPPNDLQRGTPDEGGQNLHGHPILRNLQAVDHPQVHQGDRRNLRILHLLQSPPQGIPRSAHTDHLLPPAYHRAAGSIRNTSVIESNRRSKSEVCFPFRPSVAGTTGEPGQGSFASSKAGRTCRSHRLCSSAAPKGMMPNSTSGRSTSPSEKCPPMSGHKSRIARLMRASASPPADPSRVNHSRMWSR